MVGPERLHFATTTTVDVALVPFSAEALFAIIKVTAAMTFA